MKHKILVTDFHLGNFCNLRSLAAAGHDVYVTNSAYKDGEEPREYYKSFGITILDWWVCRRMSLFMDWVEDNNIDLIINADSTFPMPRRFVRNPNIAIYGLTERAAHLETRKLWCRREVEKLGVGIPKPIDEMQVPCVLQYRKNVFGHTSVILTEDHAKHVQKTLEKNKIARGDYQYEEYIANAKEYNISFTIAGGKWVIDTAVRVVGMEQQKIAGEVQLWQDCSRFGEWLLDGLTEEEYRFCMPHVSKILDWAVQWGGEYSGLLGFLIKDDKFYFMEINARPEQSNSASWDTIRDWDLARSGAEYLEGIKTGDPYKMLCVPEGTQGIRDFEGFFVTPKTVDSIYPFHLHEKYDVPPPQCLDIIDGEYRISRKDRSSSSDGLTSIFVMKLCPKGIPEAMKDDIEATGEWTVTNALRAKPDQVPLRLWNWPMDD